ncbi:MAG: SDR family oxidoreductase [Deltaproteobacteria bacterium]|nr:MAG: SDR family oxidoreductase [Deltaproteobacteria bacterium]TNF29817.1 MAG: SDR family oxidoreductase [Deltaproteobacteria bacterium]
MEKYALVTGCSSGLGFEMVNWLLDEGYVVFGVSRSGLDINNGNYIDIVCDIRDEDEVREMVEMVNQNTYGLHLIINNAGIFEMASLKETTSESFLDHLQTNVQGTFHVLRSMEDFLIENETHIVTISSVASKKGFANVSAYCASKFALNGLIESVREEWKRLGVRFSTLKPGAIDTPLWDGVEDFDREEMMTIEDFMHVFSMVVDSPPTMQFPEISFMHKSGVLE